VKLNLRPRLRAPFPLSKPTWPGGVERPPLERKTGMEFDTEWARRYPARVTRAALVDDVFAPVIKVMASPHVSGLDRLATLPDDEPVVFAANHHSHFDTTVLLTALPDRFRHRVVVAAASDYFFDNRVKGAVWALAIGAFPIERTKVSRRSADDAAALLNDGWSLIIFPEGGRSPHGWGQPFRAGAAYLAIRCGRAVVPVHLEGTRRVMRKGARLPTPSTVHVTFGKPMGAGDGEDARDFAARIEREVAALADEQATDWWQARRRAAAGTTPPLTGPDAGAWRRTWALGEGKRRRPGPRWPK
jgi:1-acyl-sn-glycerol-3-phosphate acyltransferase